MTTSREKEQARALAVRISSRLKDCKTKKERRELERDFRAAARLAGVDLDAEHRKRRAEIVAHYKQAAMALTREKRQEVLDAIRKGLTAGEACGACGVSQEEVIGVYRLNLKIQTYRILNEETV